MDSQPIHAVETSIGLPLYTDPVLAKKEIFEQFESLLVEMLMQCMGEANHLLAAFPSINAPYPDLFDSPISWVASPSNPKPEANLSIQVKEQTKASHHRTDFNSTADFVKNLWPAAKSAATILGVDPKFLLAQAALETNWGKSILTLATGESTHNLFNIKADRRWTEAATQINAVEYDDGVMIHSKSKFRAYESYEASFVDYVHFLKNNGRYEEALKHTDNPHQFAAQLQKASFATDSQYADKMMQIYSSKRLNDLVAVHDLI
jgi:flagellar protein FlgJ